MEHHSPIRVVSILAVSFPFIEEHKMIDSVLLYHNAFCCRFVEIVIISAVFCFHTSININMLVHPSISYLVSWFALFLFFSLYKHFFNVPQFNNNAWR